MRKVNYFLGLLACATIGSMSSCSHGSYDEPVGEKAPVIISSEYLINGKVTDAKGALSGVVVKSGNLTATTDANGSYSLKMQSEGTYEITFTKATHKSTKSSVTLIKGEGVITANVNVAMAELAIPQPASKDVESILTATTETAGADEEVAAVKVELAATIPAAALEEDMSFNFTPYVPAPVKITNDIVAETKASAPAMGINIQPSVAAFKDGKKATLSIKVEAATPDADYLPLNVVYVADDGSQKPIGEATYDKGTYSTEVAHFSSYEFNGVYDTQISQVMKETITTGSFSNPSQKVAKKDLKIAKTAGYKVTNGLTGVDNGFACIIRNIITAIEGTAGTYSEDQNSTLNASGYTKLDYTIHNTFRNITYTFKSKQNKTFTITVKRYTGVTIDTKETSIGHSGGNIN